MPPADSPLGVGAQKLVPTLEAAHERIAERSLKLEDAGAFAAYGQNSYVGKVLEIRQEQPGRIHVVLVRQSVGDWRAMDYSHRPSSAMS